MLQERIHLPGEPVPSDHKLWKQCHNYGLVVPIYDAKKESKLQDFVEPSNNPFNERKTITGLGNKMKKNSYQYTA